MDHDELSRIVNLFYDDVKRIAYVGCKDIYDAEDIAQTVFLKFLKTSKTFESDDHIKNWLLRVTINESRSLWRSPWKTKVDFVIPDNIPYGKTEITEEPYILEAILNLKQKNREIVHLYYYEEYSAKEIAEVLSISEDTVYKRLQRARNQIKEYILRKKDEEAQGGKKHERIKR